VQFSFQSTPGGSISTTENMVGATRVEDKRRSTQRGVSWASMHAPIDGLVSQSQSTRST